ncbi:MAG: flavodoxin family protein [Proteobacteria bacterium]|nr:flavodoxin family protein [Pseudomonadota bacterium]
MKVLVTYYSETGNTEKLARAIFEGIRGKKVQKDILPMSEVKDLEEYGLIFCGFPVHASSVPRKVEPFLKGIPKDKLLAIFSTHGSLRGGQLAVHAFEYALSLAAKAKIIGTFGCRGKVKHSLIEALMKKPEHRAWAEEAQSSVHHHPDDADFEDGRDFAKKMIKKALDL